MKKLDFEQVREERPNLSMELEWRRVSEAYILNDVSTGPEADKQGKKTLIIYAKGLANDYIIQSNKGKPDRFYTWIHYGEPLGQAQGAGYIVIDKAKVGRKKREITEQERAEILARHEKGEGIGKIAKALHMGTRRVMGVISSSDG